MLLTLSSTAYAFFYYQYIPQINLERFLYLQYDASGTQLQYPYAAVALDTNALISQQAYDVSLVLDMPRCGENLDAGNFMLDLTLLAPKAVPDALAGWLGNTTSLLEDVLHRSRRPAILPYASPVLNLSHTLLHLPWHLLRLKDLDRARLVVPMFEMLVFARGARNIPSYARLEVQATNVLRVYEAKLVFSAKFQGMRFLIYNYRVASFLVFTALFYGVSVGSLGVGWAVISRVLASAKGQRGRLIKHEGGESGKKEQGDEKKIKTEDQETTESSGPGGLSLSNISDTPAQYPSGRGRPPLTYEGRSGGPSSSADVWASTGGGAEEDERLRRPVGAGEAADDEDDGDMVEAKEEDDDNRGRAFDSGIGTSMESEHAGLGVVRRRSERGSKKR